MIVKYLRGLFYENNEPSRASFMALVAFLAFLMGSAYLIIKDQTWAHYETFATLTMGGGVGTVLSNKLMNLTKASPADMPFIKNNREETK